MLRSRPTTLSLTTSELKDLELRSRYRKYLRTTGKAMSTGKAPVRLSKGPFYDHLVLPRPIDGEHASSSADGSDLEADRGFIRLGSGVASLSGIEVGQSVEVSRGVNLTLDQDSAPKSERTELLEGLSGHTTHAEGTSGQRSRSGGARDSAVVLPPPFSSTPRVLTGLDSPTLATDDTTLGADGCGDVPPVTSKDGEGDVEELASQFDDHLILNTAESAGSSRECHRRAHRSVDGGNLSLDDDLGFSSALDIIIYDDTLPPSQQPQTPRHLPEACHQSRLDGSQTAPVSSRTRLGLAQAGASSRDEDVPFMTPSARLGRAATAESPVAEEWDVA